MAWIHLIRHGRTAWNRQGLIQGHEDVPLDEAGRAQADALPERLRAIPLAAVWSSPLTRARQTATPLAQSRGLPLRLDARLMERNWGVYQGMARTVASARFPEVERQLRTQPRDAAPTGGESWTTLRDRALAAIWDVADDAGDGHAAVVAHGGTIAAVLNGLLHTDPWAGAAFVLYNASVTLLRCEQHGEALIYRVNDAGCLD